MCFTKSYAQYFEGTGSVFTPLNDNQLTEKLDEIKQNDEDINLKMDLKLRFFTPTEVSKLMCFPSNFKFPENFERKAYKLLGNSLNVHVVSELIKLLYNG